MFKVICNVLTFLHKLLLGKKGAVTLIFHFLPTMDQLGSKVGLICSRLIVVPKVSQGLPLFCVVLWFRFVPDRKCIWLQGTIYWPILPKTIADQTRPWHLADFREIWDPSHDLVRKEQPKIGISHIVHIVNSTTIDFKSPRY